jgi:LmbE family N-acetylglucosaminyl deacetylase
MGNCERVIAMVLTSPRNAGIRIAGWAAAATLAGACLCANAQQQQLQNPYIQPQLNIRQLPVNQGTTALWQDLQKLHTRASLLMIVAHPDDEDGGMLTYEARGMGVRAGMLTLNRGEGGQNVVTGDFNDALGLIRTQELLKADEYLGVDQMFGSVADFGFSKTMEETLANWGYDRVLCDAVRAVRVYRPLVVTSVFIGGVTDGHGHHQVAGRLAQEVFNAAGDPSVCADQIKEGLQPWQPLKVYERVPSYSISDKGIYDYATGQYAPAKFYNYITKTWSDETPSADVTIPEGTYSPLLGMSYLQFARIGLGEQKTQNGGGAVPAAGAFDVPYHRYGSRVDAKDKEEDFFDGIDTSLAGIATLAPGDAELPKELTAIDADVAQAMEQYSVADTAAIVPLLRDGLQKTDALLNTMETAKLTAEQKYGIRQELLRKQAQFNDALVVALGLSLRAQENTGAPLAVTPGEAVSVNVQVDNPSKIPLDTLDVKFASPLHWGGLKDQGCVRCGSVQNNVDVGTYSLTVPIDAQPTQPYFTRPNIEQPYYDIADASLRGQPASPYPLTAWATVTYNGVPITLGEVVQTAHPVNGQGTVYQPLVIVPAISVTLAPSAGVIPLDAKSVTLTARVHNDAPDDSGGTVHLNLPPDWSAEPSSAPFHFTHRGEETSIAFTVTPKNLAAQSYVISAVAESGGKTYTEGYTTVGYPGLTPTNLYRAATYKTSGVDVHLAPGLRIAYLPGTGDDVPQSLTALGVNVHTLAVSELASANLSQYDEIVLGVRAYNAHPELEQMQLRLNAYMEDGGVVIAQYNTAPFASTAQHPIAPYPFALIGTVKNTVDPVAPETLAVPGIAENVVQEQAPVSLLLPEHPLLNWPNRIAPHDFDGWVEERGHSFLSMWDPHYDALTETHDDGQDPQRGGLLYARSGCGAYVYVAYALYRQLPEGVPGAYRLFANLLSLPKNPQAVGCAATH